MTEAPRPSSISPPKPLASTAEPAMVAGDAYNCGPVSTGHPIVTTTLRELIDGKMGSESIGRWRGARPCTTDMKPIIGRAPEHEGLWFAFGHGHQGFTLGPVTGLLLAQMMEGETPIVDLTPFSPARCRSRGCILAPPAWPQGPPLLWKGVHLPGTAAVRSGPC